MLILAKKLTLMVAGAALAVAPLMAQQTGQRSDAVSVETKLITGDSSVTGAIVDDANVPVRGVTITVIGLGNGQVRTVSSDANGQFEIAKIPAGEYVMTLAKAGFLNNRDGKSSVNAFQVKGALALGTIRMVGGGVLTGRVLDEHGEPVVKARVSALRSSYSHEGPRHVAVASASTNDLGEYRLAGLAPARFYLVATQPGAVQTTGPKDTRVTTPTFYPAVLDVATAQRVSLAPGKQLPSLDITLRTAIAGRIRGTASDSAGRPLSGVSVKAVPLVGDVVQTTRTAIVDKNGRFEMTGLAPGAYSVQVSAPAGKSATGTSVAENDEAAVTVVEGTESVVQLATGTIVRRTGRITGIRSLNGPMSLQVFSAVPGVSRGGRAQINGDGTFTIDAPPGRYLIRFSQLPDAYSLQSVDADGADVTDTGVVFSRTSQSGALEIEVTNRFGSLTVTTTEKGKPTKARSLVVLFAQDQSRWGLGSRFVRSTRTDAVGGAVFHGLPAGSYYVAALTTELLPQELLDPEILRDVIASSTSVRIADGNKESARAEVQPLIH